VIILCDECAPDDCEELTIGILVPGACELCERPDSARHAFKLRVLKDAWASNGRSPVAGTITGRPLFPVPGVGG
jgi:hypothetical protein